MAVSNGIVIFFRKLRLFEKINLTPIDVRITKKGPTNFRLGKCKSFFVFKIKIFNCMVKIFLF